MSRKDTKSTIAFQGLPGAHSDMACKQAYPYMTTLPCPSFEDVFEAVQQGQAALGLIPIENSHAGRVAEIHNLLPGTDLHIVGEYFHKVHNHLLAPRGASLKTLKTVYSHPQALMQCRNNVRKLKLKAENFADTAGAAKAIAEWNDPSKAAIASDLAAELYGLDILKKNMQDADDNTTLFVAISKEPTDPDPLKDGPILTTMLFTTRNISAGLYKALAGFATNGINLVKLESYIPNYRAGTAQFFVTFEGHPEEKHVQHALEELGFFTKKVQLLGVYPADKKRFAG